jgi:hypothetical protein
MITFKVGGLRLAVVAVVAAGALLAAVTPAAASTPVATLQPTLVRVASGPVTAPDGTIWTVWGNTSTGKPFSFSYVQGQTLPAAEQTAVSYLQRPAGGTAVTSQVVAECEGGTIFFAVPGGSSGAPNFDWTTTQTCTGDFGLQSQRTQLQRTSYRGWLGYSDWSDWTTWSGNSTVTLFWSAGCNSGAGTYDYRVAAQGQALYIGTGPIAYTGGIQANCGPTL